MERLVVLVAIFGVSIGISSADKVPVLIWSNDRTLSLPHPLAGHTISSSDFASQYLNALSTHDALNTVLFIQDKLSLCDITLSASVYDDDSEDEDSMKHIKAILASKSTAQLPSVDSPAAAVADLRSLYDGSIHELQSPYQIADLSMGTAGRNLIVVRLPSMPAGETAYRKSLKNIDEIVESVDEQLDKLTFPYVAVYTAMKSNDKEAYKWRNSDEKHAGRQLLEMTTASPNVDMPLAFINGSFMLYVGNMTLTFGGKHYNLEVQDYHWNVTGCENSTIVDNCTVVLKYLLDSVIITMTMTKTKSLNSGYWYLSAMTVTMGSETANMKTTFMDLTPIGYSFSCSPKTNISSSNSTSTTFLTLQNFQVQAFFKSEGPMEFGMYNDCVGFFTVPIWMGVLSSMVLIAILLFGVIMLMDVKTMDRFDDPKGKTITITATD